ncbi:MAG TPA: lysine biosynthesis protein LysW [Candidatus Paceibacterota bacterium]
MKLVCPECKNDIDLSVYKDVAKGQIIECNHCGITIEIIETAGQILEAEIVDEGK